MIDLPQDLAQDLAHWAFGFTLLITRIAACLVLLPGLGEVAAPATLRIGFALAVTLLLLPVLMPAMPIVPEASLRAGLMVGGEAVTGLWFGWLARMITLALPIGLQFIAYVLGLASVLQPDPELGAQSTALASMASAAVPLILLASGLYALPLEALVGLYRLVPPGSLLPPADSAAAATRAASEVLLLAVRLASPFIVAAIVWNAAIGLLARMVPRMQIYFVAMPGQLLGGLLLLAGLAGSLLTAWQEAVRLSFGALPGIG